MENETSTPTPNTDQPFTFETFSELAAMPTPEPEHATEIVPEPASQADAGLDEHFESLPPSSTKPAEHAPTTSTLTNGEKAGVFLATAVVAAGGFLALEGNDAISKTPDKPSTTTSDSYQDTADTSLQDTINNSLDGDVHEGTQTDPNFHVSDANNTIAPAPYATNEIITYGTTDEVTQSVPVPTQSDLPTPHN